MSETGEYSRRVFPEFNGALARWQQDLSVLERALQSPSGFEYHAQLPEIIGYLSPEEAMLLSRLPEGSEVSLSDTESIYGFEYIADYLPSGFHKTGAGLRIAHYLLPNLITQIESDMATTTGGRSVIHFVEVEKTFTQAGKPAKGRGGLHVDDRVGDMKEIHNSHYLIANNEPTVFYRGLARLFRLPSGRLRLDANSLEVDGEIVQAPRLAIVRTNGATVHASPRVARDVSRTWLRISTGFAVQTT